MDGVEIRNAGRRPCTLQGPLSAVVSDPGRTSIPARLDAFGLGKLDAAIVLAPAAAASVIIAESHSCAVTPHDHYHYVTLRLDQRKTLVYLPDRSSSANPDFSGRRLALAVSPSCPPLLSGLLTGLGAPGDVM